MPKRTIKEIKPYTLKSGEKRYGFKTYLGLDSNGKPIKITRKGFKTYNDAADKYNELRAQGTQGYVKPKQIRLADLWALWFESFKLTVKESNANRVYQLYKIHVLPYFGNAYMDQITPTQLQKWVEDLVKKLKQYKRPINLMNRLFDYAYTLDYVKENPTKKLIIPRISKNKEQKTKKKNFYEKYELDEFLKDAKEFNFKFYVYFLLLVSCGLRRGEGMGLMWEDIDLKNKKLHINRTTTVGLNNKTIVQEPKTVNSKRTLPLSDNLVSALTEYKKQCYSEKLFPKVDGGWKTPSDARSWLYQIYKKYPNLRRITCHGFRHTYATLLIQAGVNIKEVQHLMGHETINITLDIYTHATQEEHDDAIQKLNSLNI